jgi:RHS repeat-associated protein
MAGSVNLRPQQQQCSAPYLTTFHADTAGSPILATNSSGDILWKEHYTPFGERLANKVTGSNTQFFHGKEQDSSTGLQYFGARWYDPSIGRFMGVDPAGLDAEDEGDSGLVHEFNRYAFSANNPYKYTDPDGRFPIFSGKGNAPRYAVVGATSNPGLG